MRNFTLRLAALATLIFSGFLTAYSQGDPTISFNSSQLIGESIINPTSLQFGPDGRLYVAQQNGKIEVYTVERDDAPPGSGTYTVTATEEIDLVKDEVPNHNDDGAANSTQKRQVTGLLVTGTATTPIIYVTSSDWRIGGGSSGSDLNLDTNSGVLSKLTKTTNGWEKIDLVRGLPRCEENHSTNGLALSGNTLLIQSGGHTNKGAPSNNFSGTPEYMLSGVLLRVDLAMLEGMQVYNDPRSGGTAYVYDLPTLNDPTRTDIDNTNPAFPYPSGHPLYNATIDVGDPFGGNNSLNQAIFEPGGPVQIFSPGYRNAYDVVITEDGHIFTSDNGPNGGWGGQPLIYELNTATPDPDDYILKGVQGVNGVTFDPANGDYISNELNESNSSGHDDPLHYVGTLGDADGTYYAGHPAPIQAFPSKAQVIVYQEVNNGEWQEIERHDFADLLVGVAGYFNTSLSLTDFPDHPEQGEYLTGEVDNATVNILDAINSSTNGITEYTASNFGGLMQGNILTASFNGNIYRYKIAPNKTSYEEKEALFSGFGSQPLDVTAQGDDDPFPGTVWAATYGSANITVFEPTDFGNCLQPGEDGYDPTADYDGDGFSNGDEILAGTNHCSGGSVPDDFDGDFSPDVVDDDDDNDGILDVVDAFAQDPDNGTTTDLPIDYPFWNNDPGTGLFGLGFTGLMSNGTTDYLDQYEINNLSPGGAAGKMGIDAVTEGDALTNTQDNGFQFGINVDANSNPFTVRSALESPFFLVNGSATTPVDNQSQGIYIGTGDQDNYLRVVFQNGENSGDNVYGMEVLLEDNGTVTSTTYDVAGIENAAAVEIYISVNPASGTAQPSISLNGGGTVITLGTPVSLPASFLDPNDNQGLAVGIIGTSAGPGDVFGASWDYMTISEDQPGILAVDPTSVDFGNVTENSSASEIDVQVTNLGSPSDGNITISAISFNGTDAGSFSTSATTPTAVVPGNEFLLPIIFTPGAVLGPKSATLVITHDGSNSPLEVPLTAVVVENDVPIIRINGGDVMASATDDGPDWEANNDLLVGESFTVISDDDATSTHDIPLTGRHSSIPDYIDDATFLALFKKERWDKSPDPELQYFIPLPNEEYKVNLYLGNGWDGSSAAGQRVFSIAIEGTLVEEDLDLSGTYGHQVGVMLQYPVTVSDGELNIEFLHGPANNPIVNAIEIIGPPITDNSISVVPISDQVNEVGDVVELAVAASGGDLQENFTYSISGQPQGVDIESTNGQIFGTIDAAALTGGSNGDGVHDVTVTVEKNGSDPVSLSFQWSIVETGTGTIAFRVNAGGALQSDPETDWAGDQADELNGGVAGGSATSGTPSPYVNSDVIDQTFGATPAGFVNNTGYPDALFATERYSNVANPNNMQWDFPVNNGSYQVNLLFAERWTGATEIGIRVFDVQIEGVTELSDFDQTETYGWNTAGVETFLVEVSDGNLDIDFIKNLENPSIKAIEIIDLNDTPTDNLPPVVTNPGDQFNVEGDVVSLPVAATAPESGQTLTYSATGLPPTLTMDPSTGVISGTIDAGSGSGEQAFEESNGLVIIEAESRPSVGGWQTQAESGVTYQVATTNHFGNTDGGTINYEIQVTTPGVYRFQMKSDITGTNTTEENDSWFKFAQTDDVHWVCVVGGISSEQQLIDNINGTASDKTFYYPNGSGLTPTHVGENPGVNGFFKVYRSGSGGNKWDAKTIDNNGFPIYAYFVNPGTYTLQMSERSGGHKVDRFALYKVDDYGTGVPTATLDGTESTQSDPATAGAAADSPYDVEVVVTDDGDPVESTTVNFQWFVSAENALPGALVQVNPGAGLNASTFDNNSFVISNTGESDIVNITIDLSTSVLPESVFDPLGLAGDNAAKCITAGSNATPAQVGLTIPGDNGSSDTDPDCSTAFASPHNGVDGDEGFDVLTLDFTDFNTGEVFSFGVDIDPVSIKNDNTAGDAGSVSGFELAGATVSITFANGQTLTTTLWDEGSIGGSQAVAEEVIPDPAPSIEMVGLSLPTVTNEANQTVRITGTPNAAVTLLQVDARLYIDAGGGGYDIDPFEANTAVAKALYTATLDGSGIADVPVTLLQTSSPDAGPDGGLNHFLAVENGTGEITSTASNVLVVEYDPTAQPGGNLALNIALQGRTDHSGIYTVEVYATSDLTTPLHSYTDISADAAGAMTLPDQIADGTYRVAVKHAGFLQRVIDVTMATSHTATVPELLAGDVDGNNFVNIDDFDLLSDSFFIGAGDPGFNAAADFDGNGFINIDDFDFLSDNFFTAGESVVQN